MSNESEFQRLDEEERVFAPEQLPAGDPEHERVRDDENVADDRAGIIAVPPPGLNSGSMGGALPFGAGILPIRVDDGGPANADDAEPADRD